MSSDKLDMSLEDIIKMNKQAGNDGRGSGRRNPTGYRRGVGRRGGRSYDVRNREVSDNSKRFLGVSRGGFQKHENRTSSFTKSKVVPDQWQHDLFEAANAPVRRQTYDDRRQDGDKKSETLLISNLHFGVSDTDMKELFGEFGPLVKAVVHYDRSGRSLGTAEVVFERKEDALRAMKQYNNVPLDGEAMQITMKSDGSQASSRNLASRIGPINKEDVNRPQRRQAGEGNRGRGAGQRRGGPRQRTVPTKEELDAELDAYSAKMETD